MAKTSFSFCPLILCSSSTRHIEIQYCWWKKSCTTFKGLHLKPRAPNLILFEDTVIKHFGNGFARVTAKSCIHLNMSFNIDSLGVLQRGYIKYASANLLVIEAVQDFFLHHRRKKRPFHRSLEFFVAPNFFPSPATSRGLKIHQSDLLIVPPPVCFTLHLHTAEHEAKWATWQPPHATLQTTRNTHATLHATLTQHYTLHYTQHYQNAVRGSISGQDRKSWLVFSFHSLKASKLQNAAPASSSVVLRAV